MNIRDFYQLVELEREPDAGMLTQLQFLTKKYPFFQAGIFTYIKCLYLLENDTFRNELKRLAAFVIDRKALFYYVMNNQFKDFQKQAEKRLTQDRTDFLINAFFDTLSDKVEEERRLEHAIVNSSMASLDYFSYLESESSIQTEINLGKEKKSKTDEILENFDFGSLPEDISISESYTLTEETTVEEPPVSVPEEPITEETSEDSKTPSLKHQDIIDRFISKAENRDDIRIKMERSDSGDEEDMDNMDEDMDGNASEKELDDDIFFTQTLANIYIKQKKYNRAYEIIKRLSLNYPEKNTYFADQLSFLEKLIKNSNKKTK